MQDASRLLRQRMHAVVRRAIDVIEHALTGQRISDQPIGK
jgi:hypothetical protein